MDAFLKILLGLVLLLLLIGLPLALSIWRGWWWKTVLLTWFIWVTYGACVPALARLREIITGESADVDGVAFFGGILFGWFPGLILASIGIWMHGLIKKNKKQVA